METKHFNCKAEFKLLDDKKGIFEGYGSIFGNIDSYRDIVEKGAFERSLRENGLPTLLWQHDTREVIGRYTEAVEDERGLRVRGELNLDVQKGKEAYALLKQGAMRGLSIGYIVRKYEIDEEEEVKRLTDVDLMEVSVVTFPANREATVTNTKRAENIRDFEILLREVGGYSASQAKLIAAKGFRAFEQEQREVSGDNDEDLQTVKHELENILKGLQNEK